MRSICLLGVCRQVTVEGEDWMVLAIDKRQSFGNSILTQTQFKLNSNSTQARNSINSRSLEFEAYPANNNVALKSREHLTSQ